MSERFKRLKIPCHIGKYPIKMQRKEISVFQVEIWYMIFINIEKCKICAKQTLFQK